MAARRAASAVADLADLPLRHVVTPYDAAYIALAEALAAVLVTADARLSRASGLHCEIEAIDGASGG
jgi:predicted nucleic acid-binding protein